MPGITVMSGQYICPLTCTLSTQKPHTRRLAMCSHLVTDLCSLHRVSFTFLVSCHTQHTKSTSSPLLCAHVVPRPSLPCRYRLAPRNTLLHTIQEATFLSIPLPNYPFLPPMCSGHQSTPSHTPFCHSPSPPTSPFTSLCPLPLLLAAPLLLAVPLLLA